MSCPTALRLCYAFGSNIDVVRCGWDAHTMSNGKLTDCRIQSAALCYALLTCARFFLRFYLIPPPLRRGLGGGL
ncbi:MAG: hypothetical protein K2N54_03965 [Helicobacter sp.]|nr:hypothetical protein [Helicobacter sp.]